MQLLDIFNLPNWKTGFKKKPKKQIQVNQNVALSYEEFCWDLSSFYWNVYVLIEYILFPCLSIGIFLNLFSSLWLVGASQPATQHISQILQILQNQIFFWKAAQVKLKILSASFPAWSPRYQLETSPETWNNDTSCAQQPFLIRSKILILNNSFVFWHFWRIMELGFLFL